MSILKMKKVTIGGLKSEKEDIMYLLQRMNVMEITDIVDESQDAETKKDKEPNPELLSIRKTLSGIDHALGKIKPYYKKKGLAKPEYTLEQVNSIGEQKEHLEEVLGKISAAEQNMAELNAKRSAGEKLIELFKPYESLNMPVEEIGRSSSATSAVGFIPSANLKALDSLNSEYVYYEELAQDKDSTYVFVVMHNSAYDETMSELRTLGFAAVDLSAYKGVPREIAENCRKEDKELLEQLSKAGEIYEELSGEYEFLMVSADYYGILEQRLSPKKRATTLKTLSLLRAGLLPRTLKT